MNWQNFTNQYSKYLAGLVLAGVVFGLFIPNIASAQNTSAICGSWSSVNPFCQVANGLSALWDFGSDIMTGLAAKQAVEAFSGLIMVFRSIVYYFTMEMVLPFMDMVLRMNANDITGGFVESGWVSVRNIVNMIFVLALIAIGLATILRIESYNYKNMLVMLIIMALLINFSLFISKTILQISDVVTFSFLPQGNGPDDPGNGVVKLRQFFVDLSKIHTFALLQSNSFHLLPNVKDEVAKGTTILFQFLLELMVMITFMALGVLLLIRLVAIWMLLILSPFAYGLYILPSTKGLAISWWKNFLNYVFFLPIMAFFLRLAMLLYYNARENIPILKIGLQISEGDLVDKFKAMLSSAQDGALSWDDVIFMMVTYFVILGFLWGSMIIAKKMSIAGSDKVVGWAQKGMVGLPMAGVAGTLLAAKYVGRGTAMRHAGVGMEALGKMRDSKFATQLLGTSKTGAKLQDWGRKTKGLGADVEKGTSYIEAFPRTVTEGFKRAEAGRQKSVAKAQWSMLGKVGLGQTGNKDEITNMSGEVLGKMLHDENTSYDDVEAIFQHGTHEQVHLASQVLMEADSRLGVNGDPKLRSLAIQTLWRRLGNTGAAPAGTSLGFAPGGGFQLITPGQPSPKSPSVSRAFYDPNANSAFSTDEAFEASEITSEQRKNLEKREALARKRIEREEQAEKIPNLRKQLDQEEITGQTMKFTEAVDAIMAAEALKYKNGDRDGSGKSRVMGGGLRVIISNEVSKKAGIPHDAYMRYDPNDEATVRDMNKFVDVLKQDGVSQHDIGKVIYAATKAGGVAVQKGQFVALRPIIDKYGDSTRRRVVKENIVVPKVHERSHALQQFIRKENPADYEKMVGAIKSSNVFAQVAQKARQTESYKNSDDNDIAEEIMNRSKSVTGKEGEYDRMSEDIRNTVQSIQDKYVKQFQDNTREVIRKSHADDRIKELREEIRKEQGEDIMPAA